MILRKTLIVLLLTFQQYASVLAQKGNAGKNKLYALYNAVDNGDTKILKKFLPAIKSDKKELSQLFLKVFGLNPKEKPVVEMIKEFINNGVNVNARSSRGFTPLILASMNANNQPEIVKLLLASGAKINMQDYFIGGSALYYAVWLSEKNEANDKEIVDILLTNKADVNIQTNTGETPLSRLIQGKPNIDIINKLINNGADVNAIDIYGQTPLLHVYFNSDNDPIKQLLIAKGAKKPSDLSLFFELLCNIHPCVDDSGKISNILSKKKFNIDVRDPYSQLTPLCISIQRGRYDLFNLFLDNGAKINARCYKSRTPLLFVLANKYFLIPRVIVVKRLLKIKNIDVNAVDDDKKTALDYATKDKEKEIIELLRKYGAKTADEL